MVLVGLLVSSYIFFMFVGENYNPFMLPTGQVKRTRWRLGRDVSCVHFFSAMVALAIGNIWSVGLVATALIYVALLLVGFGILFFTKGLHKRQQPTSKDVRLHPSAVKEGNPLQTNTKPVAHQREKSDTNLLDISL